MEMTTYVNSKRSQRKLGAGDGIRLLGKSTSLLSARIPQKYFAPTVPWVQHPPLVFLRYVTHCAALVPDPFTWKRIPLKIAVDCGTGTTTVGLVLGAMCLGLPWETIAVMLSGSVDGYKMQERRLINEIIKCSSCLLIDQVLNRVECGVVQWVERNIPREFGNVLKGEVEWIRCTLATLEFVTLIAKNEDKGGVKVVMLHTWHIRHVWIGSKVQGFFPWTRSIISTIIELK
ncbi:hypothetical protein RJ641_002712, partial [Dillenia turbinata]